MRRLAGYLFTLYAASSLLWCVSGWAPWSAEVVVLGSPWRLSLHGGRLSLDDQPQRREALEPHVEQAQDRVAEAQRLYRAAEDALAAAPPGGGDALRLSLAHQQAARALHSATMS